jgi:hypothetical protein
MIQAKRILYVPDGRSNKIFLDRLEKLIGPTSTIITAPSFEEGMKRYTKQGLFFDLIIANGKYGNDKTGLDFYDQIRETFPGKFAVLTACPETKTKAEAINIPVLIKGNIDMEKMKEILLN